MVGRGFELIHTEHIAWSTTFINTTSSSVRCSEVCPTRMSNNSCMALTPHTVLGLSIHAQLSDYGLEVV